MLHAALFPGSGGKIAVGERIRKRERREGNRKGNLGNNSPPISILITTETLSTRISQNPYINTSVTPLTAITT